MSTMNQDANGLETQQVLLHGSGADGASQVMSMTGTSMNVNATNLPDVLNEQIYAGSAVGSQITDGGIEHYHFWQFHVEGVDADDDVTIQISLDGTNFIKAGLIDVMTGAHIDQTAANIEADGIYVFGTVADQATRVALGIKAIKVVRETATGSNNVTVQARAS